MNNAFWIVARCGSGLSAWAAMLFCGCATVETTVSYHPVSSHEEKKAETLVRIDAPKGSPGILEERYLVIDISGGQTASNWPVTYIDTLPSDGWDDEYKTEKIVLRKVNPGSWCRQRCTTVEAWNRSATNPPYEMSVDKSFYIGVFEITQRQYEIVTGMKPSQCSPAESWERLPVENVAYDDIRGCHKGACYPMSREVDSQSFIGILRQKTGLEDIDLPTEDVWEYCCSAGGACIDSKQLEPNAIFSHYPAVKCDRTGPAIVGTCKSNILGLYDLQGNVHEWCIDHVGAQKPGEVPFLSLGCSRVVKGGYYGSLPQLCHPSIAYAQCSSFGSALIGFRICLYLSHKQ